MKEEKKLNNGNKDESSALGAESVLSANSGSGAAKSGDDSAKKQSVILWHKTEYPRYRRAGLVLTQKAQTYEVTDEQLAALKKDPWVVIGDGK